MKSKAWFYVAFGSLIASLISMIFLPTIIVYRNNISSESYSVVKLITDSSNFEKNVLHFYDNDIVLKINAGSVVFLSLLALAAVVCAVVGLITLRAQRPNTKQFILTLVGLVGVTIPSLILLICIAGFGNSFAEGISLKFGPAPIITPITMIICIATVIRRKNKVAEELRRSLEESGKIMRAGDL